MWQCRSPRSVRNRDERPARIAGGELGIQRRGQRLRVEGESRPRVAAVGLQRLEDQRLFLQAHSCHRPNPPVASGLFEIVEGANPQLAVKPRYRFGPNALEPEQIEDGRRKLLEQLAVILDSPGLDQFTDLGGDVLADPRQRQPLRRAHLRHALRFMNDRLGRVAVRANLERVLPFDFEEVPISASTRATAKLSTIDSGRYSPAFSQEGQEFRRKKSAFSLLIS